MYDAAGTILYVGKARQLKNRVSSYFQGRPHADKTQAMVAQVARVEVTVTASEIEALLLEYNLIKQHRPRYNVLLKDDKSFPFIRLTGDQQYPRLSFYRGARRAGTRLYGPYPSAGATRETLLLLAKLFRVRQCEDTYFANRSRPCLQYQIDRCTGPCVGLVSPEAYARDVHDSVRVLEGRNDEVVADLGRRMEQAAAALEFEAAARLRDQIQMLKKIQSTQSVSREASGDVDAVALATRGWRALRRGGLRARRTEPRQFDVFPTWRTGRAGRGARGLPQPVLPGPRGAGRGAARGTAGGRRPARAGAGGAGRAPGAAAQRRARRAGALARHGAQQRGARTADARFESRDARRAAGGARRGARLAGSSDAHRVLRREPHDGRGRDRVLRRVRPRRAAEERLPSLQVARRGRPATTTRVSAKPSAVATRAWSRASPRSQA